METKHTKCLCFRLRRKKLESGLRLLLLTLKLVQALLVIRHLIDLV